MKYCFFLVLFVIISCSSQTKVCNELQYGTFKIFENNQEIGKIYRINNIQIEKYYDNDKYIKVIFSKENECQYNIRSFDINEEIDTVNWNLSYTKIKEREYNFTAKPKYITNLNYSYEGKIIKVNDSIDNSYVRKLINNSNR